MGLLKKLLGGTSASTPGAPAWGRTSAEPPVWAPSTWAQWPSLAPGAERKVVGESHYQAALEQAAAGHTSDGCRRQLVVAQLVREPTNRHDRNAVQVLVGRQCVGYIPKADAPGYHRIIDQLHDQGRPATCFARLTGGWDRGRNDRGHIGIELLIAKPFRPTTSADPFFPPVGKVAVTKEEQFQDVLSQLGEGRHVAELAMDGGAIGVWIGEQRVGQLTSKMTDRFEWVVEEIRAAGIRATCEARVARGAKKLEVELAMPQPDSIELR